LFRYILNIDNSVPVGVRQSSW